MSELVYIILSYSMAWVLSYWSRYHTGAYCAVGSTILYGPYSMVHTGHCRSSVLISSIFSFEKQSLQPQLRNKTLKIYICKNQIIRFELKPLKILYYEKNWESHAWQPMKFSKWIRYDAVCWFDCSSIVAIFRWNSLNYHFCQFQAYLPLPSDFKFTDYLGAWWLELNFWIFKLTDLVVLLIKQYFPNTISGWNQFIEMIFK